MELPKSPEQPDAPFVRSIDDAKPAPENTIYKNKGMEMSIFNMGVWDIEVIHKMRVSAHNYLEQAENDPQALILCFNALKQMYSPFYFLLTKSWQNKLDNAVAKLKPKINQIRILIVKDKTGNINAGIGSLPIRDYQGLLDEVEDFMFLVYHAKHILGLRIPGARHLTDEEKMDEAMGVQGGSR